MRHSHSTSDLTARSVRIVCWLLARPAGDTFDELLDRFPWPPAELREVLHHLAVRHQVKQIGPRYIVTPEGTWRPWT